MSDHSDKTNDKFKQAVRSYEADQRIWREGRMDELRGRVVGSIKDASEKAKTAKKTIE